MIKLLKVFVAFTLIVVGTMIELLTGKLSQW